MSQRLTLAHIVGESMIHIIEPVADQALRFVVGKLGLSGLMEEIQIVSDFKEVSKATDKSHNAKLIDYRVRARLAPNVNPSNNKWEGTKTIADLGNGNAIVRQDVAGRKKSPWSGHDITSRDISIFHNEDLFLDMTEWNVGSTLTMEVKLDFRDLTPAQECLSAIFATFTNGEMIGYVPVQYDYPIPKPIAYVLRQIYMRTNNTQSHEAYDQWLKDNSAGCLSWNVNRNNIHVRELVGLKNNAQAMYLIECQQDAPEVGSNRFTVNFNLTVQYSRTNRIIFDYPILVNNQLLPFELVPCGKTVRTANHGPFQWQNEAVTKLWNSMYDYHDPAPAKYPWWDPWNVPETAIIKKTGFHPIYTAALELDDLTNKEGVTRLNIVDDLPGYKLRDDIVSMLKEGKNLCLGHNFTYVNVSVFAHDYPVDRELLDFDGTYLTIKSRRPEPNYRLVISVNPTPRTLKPQINWVWITTIIPKKGD